MSIITGAQTHSYKLLIFGYCTTLDCVTIVAGQQSLQDVPGVPGLSCLVEVRSISHLTMSVDLVKHTGGCHCGKVRFEVLAKSELKAYDCK